VVDTGEVNDLEGEWLLAKVAWLVEGDVEPDAPKGHSFLLWHDPIEWCPAGTQAILRDAHLVEGASVEYVKATPPSISTLERHVIPTIGLTTSG
jgi:hypothetical protein